jgi:hypothetical protein
MVTPQPNYEYLELDRALPDYQFRLTDSLELGWDVVSQDNRITVLRRSTELKK